MSTKFCSNMTSNKLVMTKVHVFFNVPCTYTFFDKFIKIYSFCFHWNVVHNQKFRNELQDKTGPQKAMVFFFYENPWRVCTLRSVTISWLLDILGCGLFLNGTKHKTIKDPVLLQVDYFWDVPRFSSTCILHEDTKRIITAETCKC
jgi:hypothetical protein